MGKENKNTKSVAHIVLSLEMGGLEKIVYSMSLEQKKLGYNVYVICLDKLGIIGKELSKQGINVKHLNRKPGRIDFSVLIKIIMDIKKHRIHTIHTHNIEANVYGMLASYFSLKTKTIHTQHGIPDHFNLFKKIFMRLINLRLGKLIAVSNDTEKNILLNNWVNEKKIDVIINGVNTDDFKKKSDNQLKDKYKIPKDALILISISRIEAVKDHETMINQFQQATTKIPNIYLFIVGDGSLKENIDKLVIKYNLTNKVILTGMQKNISDYLQMSDVFIMTSISEGISISLLEAMSTELIPIVTPVGGNTQVVKDNINGYYLEKNNKGSLLNKLEIIMNNHEKNIMKKSARQKIINCFSQETMIKRYLDYYNEL